MFNFLILSYRIFDIYRLFVYLKSISIEINYYKIRLYKKAFEKSIPLHKRATDFKFIWGYKIG